MTLEKHLRGKQQIKVDVREEKPSVSSPETQPAQEIRKEREKEKIKEIQEDKSEGAAKRETEKVQTNGLKAEEECLSKNHQQDQSCPV